MLFILDLFIDNLTNKKYYAILKMIINIYIMQKYKIEETLINYGLEQSDVKIYLILNEHGELDVPKLVRHTNFSRTTIYDALNNLMEHKLVTHRKLGRTALYKLRHPENLKRLIDEKKRRDQRLERNLRADIDKLTQTFNLVSNQPGVQIFEGKEGVIKAYNELLRDGIPVDSIEDRGELAGYVGDYLKEYIKKRTLKKMWNRVIVPSTNKLQPSTPKECRETHYIDADKFPFNMHIKINKKRVILINLKEKTAVGIVIVQPEVVKNFQRLFDWMWSVTK